MTRRSPSPRLPAAPGAVLAFRGLLALLVVAVAGGAAAPPAAAPSADGADRGDVSPPARLIGAALTDGFAYEKLGELCDRVGPRLVGTAGLRRAAEWAVATMRAAGFDSVWTEPAEVPHWVRGREAARVLAPYEADLPVTALGRSVGTPEGGVTAPVLAVASFEELEARAAEASGRIVLFDPPWEGYGVNVRYRSGGASAAARHGAVACLVRSATDRSLGTLHTGVMGYAEDAPRIPAAAVTVEDAARLHRLADAGLPIRVHLELGCRNRPDSTSLNVLGEIRGRGKPEEIVVVSGHLDSWDLGTGAHDDGAGCLLAMASARLLKLTGLVPRRTVRVVLFTSEEFGGQGGRAYRDRHRDELARHVAAFESDSGAFPPAGFSVRADSLVVLEVAELARPLATLGAADVRPGWAGVDVGPLVELGVPGIGHRVEHDDYFAYHHSPADTFDKIDAGDLARNVAALAVLVHAVADRPARLAPAGDAGGTP